jgi:hypothetical protein
VSYHAVPWIFNANGTVNAGSLWQNLYGNTIRVTIMRQNRATDTFEVNFVTSRWFIGTKNDKLYRIGEQK